MGYHRTNIFFGWLCFITALVVYTLTLEPTVSFWDSGEFIAAAYKLQIVHQPGAPLYLMIGKIFSLLAGDEAGLISFWVNICSATASAATIMFLFWTITALTEKMLGKTGKSATMGDFIVIIGSGLVGAMAFTFSDSFWFSAVETEVYGLSSLCTAVAFWAILKWDKRADEPYADRWLVFIAYIMGLSIGVHLLNLLAIPAIVLVYYFRRSKLATSRGVITSLITGALIVAFIQYGIVQYIMKFAANSDLFFVNSLGLSFGSGLLCMGFLVGLSLVAGIIYSITGSGNYLRVAASAFVILMTLGGDIKGFLAASVILAGLEYILQVRRNRRALNLGLLSVVFLLFGYGSFAMVAIRANANPTLNNNQANNVFSLSGYVNREQYVSNPLFYGPYFDSKPIDSKKGGTIYRKGNSKYERAGFTYERVYDRNTVLPRVHSDDPKHVDKYRQWLDLSGSQSPTFVDNISFMLNHQIGFMYARYFAWNFVGRQNDEQGDGNYREGNWLSGIKAIDNVFLGGQYNLPKNQIDNKAYNRFYFLPLIVGLVGAWWLFKRSWQDSAVIALLFLSTGLAIIFYLNQTPGEPRERDYAYTGSFYAFAICIGLGVAALSQFMQRRIASSSTALAATVIGLLAAPVLMATDGWNDHDRSSKYSARDMAHNYLDSCAPNAILFTFGDNDTYPLWYAQEVENVRPDVRVVNLGLMNADWYIRQLKKKVNQADALPITMPDEKFVRGVRDVIAYQEYPLDGGAELKDVFELLTSDHQADKATYQDGSKENFLPTKKFKITIDPNQIIDTNTLPASRKDQIAELVEWTYNKNYLSKGDLALIDILANNNWKRPVYFSVSMPTENYIGLDDYLYNEGLAYRLLPLKKQTPDVSGRRAELINTDRMYNNMMTKFKWGNMKDAPYLDPESRRSSLTLINHFNILAERLFLQGRNEEARKALLKCIDVLPDTNHTLNFTLRKLYMADLLYKLNEPTQANILVGNTASFIEEELTYLAAIAETKNNLPSQDVQIGAYVTGEFVKLAGQNGQDELSRKLQTQYKKMESKFIGLLR